PRRTSPLLSSPPPRPPSSTPFPYTTLFRSDQLDFTGAAHPLDDPLPQVANGDFLGAAQVDCLAVAALILQQSHHRRNHITNIGEDRKSTRLNSSHVKISYAVFCLKKKSTPR